MPKTLTDFLSSLPPEMRAKVSHLPGQQQANAKINHESMANLFEVTLDIILNQAVVAVSGAANKREKRSLIRGASVALCHVSVLRSVMLELLPEGGPRESTQQVALGGFRDEIKRFEKTVLELLPSGLAVRKRALEREAAGLAPLSPLPGAESEEAQERVEPAPAGEVPPLDFVSPAGMSEIDKFLDAAEAQIKGAASLGIPADEIAAAPQAVPCFDCGGFGHGPDAVQGPGIDAQGECPRCDGSGKEPVKP